MVYIASALRTHAGPGGGAGVEADGR
jgi:hypothetical protein